MAVISSRLSMRVLIGALCVVVGHTAVTVGCGHTSSKGERPHMGNEENEGRASLEPGKVLDSQTRKHAVTEGKFREIRIGDSKEEVIQALVSMEFTPVMPSLKNVLEANRPEDIARLGNAEALIADAGAVRIVFDGDHVEKVYVAPVWPEWQAALQGCHNRKEVFQALQKLLAGPRALPIRSTGSDERWVGLRHLTQENRALLEKYDRWSVSHDETGGYLHVVLEFDVGRLVRIVVSESSGPL
jgi:hypothetical protein